MFNTDSPRNRTGYGLDANGKPYNERFTSDAKAYRNKRLGITIPQYNVPPLNILVTQPDGSLAIEVNPKWIKESRGSKWQTNTQKTRKQT